jgi:RNA polymerase sigma factor (sigma-70 family)
MRESEQQDQMRPGHPSSDEDLLLSGDAEDFGRFYDRHVHAVIGYFARRTHDPEVAADLTAETFAAALVARARFRPSSTPAAAWLFGIAQHKLSDYRRRGHAEDRARRRLGMQRVPLAAGDAELIGLLGREVASDLVSSLPGDQRDAVSAHVIDDRPYAEIAAAEHTSEAVVRKRVSRGLRALRERMEPRR